jgi:hypothetical protein
MLGGSGWMRASWISRLGIRRIKNVHVADNACFLSFLQTAALLMGFFLLFQNKASLFAKNMSLTHSFGTFGWGE